MDDDHSQVHEAGISLPLIALFKCVLYADAQPQQTLLRLQARVRDYVAIVGLGLMLDET